MTFPLNQIYCRECAGIIKVVKIYSTEETAAGIAIHMDYAHKQGALTNTQTGPKKTNTQTVKCLGVIICTSKVLLLNCHLWCYSATS
jgi:hypothetical protein